MMQLIRYSDPFRALMRDLVGEETRATGFVPPLDIAETDDAYIVSVELPGIDPESVELSIEDGVLDIKGTKSVEKDEKTRWHRTERRLGEFARQIRLPNEVDAEAVEAESRHGVLAIRLPKRAETRGRKIEIRKTR